ncbi:MAG: DNA polymerase III subunit delta [Alphaproteobacteria bacterium]
MLLLAGDPLLVGERLDAVQEKAVGKTPAFGAMDVLQGDRATLEDLATAIGVVAPGGRRLVVLRHAEKLREEVQKGLVGLLESVPVGTTVAILAENPDLRRSLFASLKDRTERLEIGSSRDPAGTRRDLVALVSRRSKALGLRLSPEAAEAIVDHVGNEPGRIVRELEKLALRWGDAPVGPREALDGIGGDRALAAFALEGALRERRIGRAIVELRSLFAQGERSEMVLGSLAGEMRSLLRARALLDSGLDEEAAKRAFGGGRGWFVVPRARNWRRAEIESALRSLSRIDVASKTGAPAVEARLERWLVGLARASSAR